MSTREQIQPTPVFNSVTSQDMSGNLTSLVTTLPGMSLISYDVSWVGAGAAGSLSVEVSNSYSLDAQGNPLNAGNWSTLPFEDSSGSIVTSISVSGPGNDMILLSDLGCKFIRIVFTASGGSSGTLSALVAGKVS